MAGNGIWNKSNPMPNSTNPVLRAVRRWTALNTLPGKGRAACRGRCPCVLWPLLRRRRGRLVRGGHSGSGLALRAEVAPSRGLRGVVVGPLLAVWWAQLCGGGPFPGSGGNVVGTTVVGSIRLSRQAPRSPIGERVGRGWDRGCGDRCGRAVVGVDVAGRQLQRGTGVPLHSCCMLSLPRVSGLLVPVAVSVRRLAVTVAPKQFRQLGSLLHWGPPLGAPPPALSCSFVHPSRARVTHSRTRRTGRC
eukprot:gene8490-biopygen15167